MNLFMIWYFALTGVSLAFFCFYSKCRSKVSKNTLKTLFPDNVLVYGHQAGKGDAAPNTLEAIREAYKNGAQGVEIDLVLTSDNHIVLCHDTHLDLVADGNGSIDSYTLQELQNFNIKHQFSYTAKFATAADAISLCAEYGLIILLDVKVTNFVMIEELMKLFKSQPYLYTHSITMSFDPIFLYRIRWRDPSIALAFIYRHFHAIDNLPSHRLYAFSIDVFNLVMLYTSPYLVDLEALNLHHSLCHSEQSTKFYKYLANCMVWTVNSNEDKLRCQSLNVNYITDYIKNDTWLRKS